jgi:2,4-dienoyl-CoA reductase-like NADH-dependent reductase (Old Yellow Enzyme family)
MKTIFDNVNVGKLNLKNRFIRSATAEKISDSDGIPPAKLTNMYKKLTEGEIGVIITGHAYVDRQGKAHSEMSAMDRDSLIEIWHNIIEPIKKTDTKIIMQINHAGGSVDTKETPNPVSPSGISFNKKTESSKLTEEQIENIIVKFARAAERVKKAGFDGVQIHAAHGYLINQFMLPYTNKRQDKWGGSIENRFRILKNILKLTREKVGDDFPIWIKLGVAGEEKFGLNIDEGKIFAKMAFEEGANCIEISNAASESKK